LQWSPIVIVIGFPLNEDGSSSRLTALVKKFASKIKNKFDIKISLIDERFTSIEAEILLKETDANVKKRKSVIDQVAAQIILTSFFEGAEHVVT
jgi:putative Holliday junction resolvase